MNIMPQAINETVRGFEGAHIHPVTPDLGAVAVQRTEIETAVDSLYDKLDPAMLRVLTKLASE